MDKQKIEDRLQSLGYVIKPGDENIIPFVMEKVESTIKSSCNTTSIPEGLTNIAIDMVCGEFLYFKKQSGQLEEFDTEVAVKKVKLGDTDITFDESLSPEQRLDNLIHNLKSSGKEEFSCYRRIRW